MGITSSSWYTLISLVPLIPYSSCFWGTSPQGWTTTSQHGSWTTSLTDYSVRGYRTVNPTWLSAAQGICWEQSWLPSFSPSTLQISSTNQLTATANVLRWLCNRRPHHRWGQQGVQRTDSGICGLFPAKLPTDQWKENPRAGGRLPQEQTLSSCRSENPGNRH